MTDPAPSNPLIFIISGPAGSGKTTLCDAMLEKYAPKLQQVITTTTRAPRKGEVNDVDYHFISKNLFQQKLQSGDFYEHATVHGQLYGTERAEIENALSKNIDLLLNIDIQGAKTIIELAKTDPLLQNRVISVFVTPKSIEELKKRLETRGLDNSEEINRRLEVAKKEILASKNYDHCITSSSKTADFKSLETLYSSEKAKATRN